MLLDTSVTYLPGCSLYKTDADNLDIHPQPLSDHPMTLTLPG